MSRINDGESVSEISCAVWQSEQTGAFLSPCTRSSPCTLLAYISVTPTWQRPHVSGTFRRFTSDTGSFDGRISCGPWQSAQVAATVSPALVTACPCTDSRYCDTC